MAENEPQPIDDEYVIERLPMSPVDFTVLLVLIDGDSHGYAIVKEMRERSDGRIDIWPGNFYTVMHRLERDGLIEPSDRKPEGKSPGRPRRLYRITDLGLAVARAEAARIAELSVRPDVKKLLGESR